MTEQQQLTKKEKDHIEFRDFVPGIYRFRARIIWLYNEDTRTEDKAPQGCDLSADSSAGMASDGFKLEAVANSNLNPADH